MEEGCEVVRHRRVQTNGIWMHVAEQGAAGAPLVLLIHGFPELWFSWRHQMSHLARRGFRAVAPDLRGYGDSDAPPDHTSYTILHLVGDLIGLLDHLQQPREQGRAEKAFARHDCLTVMKKFLSIEIPELIAPSGMEIIDFLDMSLPPWINEEEVQYFASKFQKSGFTGPLNYYRMMDTNWELLAPWQGAKISVPTKFIVGDKDLGFKSFRTMDYITGETFRTNVPNLEVVVIDGHHFLQQEKAVEVTTEILSFFGDLAAE